MSGREVSGRAVASSPARRTCAGANDVELVADAFGDPDRPAVLLLHGGGQTRHSWGNTAESLGDAGFYAVTADLRGHGESSWDPNGDYSFTAQMADVEAWCRLLDRPAVVGASLGGLAALWTEGTRAADREPPAGSSLVLVDIAHRSAQVGVDRIMNFMSGNPDGFASVDEAADAVAEYLPHRPRPSNTDGLARNLRLGEDGRFRWHWDPEFMSGNRPRSSTDFEIFTKHARRLMLPVLLVRGGRSDVLSRELAEEFLTIVPHAEFADVGDAHHMVAGDQNDVFSAAVIDFLTRVAGPRH
jgi:pimeloyl-ACP methyl ester carboxylesterase